MEGSLEHSGDWHQDCTQSSLEESPLYSINFRILCLLATQMDPDIPDPMFCIIIRASLSKWRALTWSPIPRRHTLQYFLPSKYVYAIALGSPTENPLLSCRRLWWYSESIGNAWETHWNPLTEGLRGAGNLFLQCRV